MDAVRFGLVAERQEAGGLSFVLGWVVLWGGYGYNNLECDFEIALIIGGSGWECKGGEIEI